MDINIVNNALIKLGEPPISSKNETPVGSVLEIVYENCRELLLSSYPWRFAIKRVELAPVEEKSDNPLFIYKYNLPTDCLIFRDCSPFNKPADLRDYRHTSFERYQIEGNTIYGKTNKQYVEYIADIKDTTKYSVLFKEALALKIASELTVKFHQNLNLSQMLEAKYQMAISQAIEHNEIIADSEEMPDNSWISVREGWKYGY